MAVLDDRRWEEKEQNRVSCSVCSKHLLPPVEQIFALFVYDAQCSVCQDSY
ncbi:Hypothetical predicted protein [Podarcis lilfordi]|uniref:Uncharacterized protein n=1 Tax=Podarcis lilfordi TaxID=74358 RepID=A0AA35P3D0_9SAUR|nr:Hypothetical predicted protein [Podarcis lilfordi]